MKRKYSLLGIVLLLAIASPQPVHAQNDNFTIAQVIVNACMGYIEVSVNVENATYQWYENDGTGNFVLLNGQTFRTISNIAPGEYRVLVTNTATGEVISGEYVLNSPFDLVARDLFSGLICDDDPNSGAMLLYFDNGTSPYSYTLYDSGGNAVSTTTPPNPGETAQGVTFILFENLNVGTYTFEWEDLFGCTGTKEVVIDAPVDISVTTSKVDPLCFGDTGSISFSVNGGWGADYKFKLTNSTTSSDVALGGFPSLNTSDGVYYDIGDGQNINLANLAAGTYQLTFFEEPLNNIFLGNFDFDPTRTTSCIVNYEIIIEEPDELVVLNEDTIINNASCFEANDGSIQLTPSGGTAPYTISWTASNGGGIPTGQGTNNILTNLSPGDYSVTITDNNNCEYTNTYTITEPSQLLLSYSTSTNISCNGGGDGVIVVEVIGGTPPYSFILNSVDQTPQINGNLYTFTNLTAGTYVISVEDSNQCTSNPSGIVQIINEPDPINITISDFALACFGDSDGIINGTISGGTAPYVIINDQTAESQTVSFDGGTFNFSSLVAGNYTFSVTDSESSSGDTGCTATASADVTEPSELTALANISNSICFESEDGEITVIPAGGTAPYTFSWTASDGGIVPTGQETSSTLSGLAAGDYQVTVLDYNGCPFIDTYTITEPAQLSLGSASFVDVSCNGGSDGSITVEVTGGTPSYTFSSNGSSIAPNNINGNLYSFTGLSAATYTLTVTDTNNCASIVAEVNQIISEPQAITHTISDFALACFDDDNGVIDGTISGGTAPYTIINDISGTSINVNTDGGSFSFNGLIAGNYTFSITDANGATGDAGCASTASATVTQPSQLAATASLSNVKCFNNSDGAILLNPAGGTGPYYFAWTTSNGTIQVGEETTASITGLPPGIYDVTITDDNGCDIVQSYEITEPNPLQITPTFSSFNSGSGSTINISCNGNSDGFINITPSGGTGPFTFQWSASNGGVVPAGQTTNQNLTGLLAGDYTLALTDDNNCTTTANFSLIAPRVLSGTAVVTQDNQCFDGSLGAIQTTIDNSGSVDGITYTYELTGANIPAGYTTSETTTQLTQQFENLPAGSYTVTVTDGNNCSFTSATQTIVQPSAPITATVTTTNYNGFNISCFGEVDADLSISVSGGTPFIDGSGNPYYTYQWTSPSASPIQAGQEITNSLSGIGVGRYQVVITDSTGACTLTQTYTITQPTDIVLSGTTSNYNGFEVSGFGLNDGSIDLTVAGGIDSQVYTYLWSASNGGTIPTGQDDDEDLSGLTKGTYSVVVTDDNGCTETISFTLTEPNELVVSEAIAQHKNVDCFGDSTGVIQIDITQGSVGPYDFTLSLGGTVVETTNTTALLYRFENLAAGNYTATVTDANGTEVVITNIVISQPASGLAASITTSSYTGPNGTFELSCFGSNEGVIDVTLSGGTPFNQGLPTAYYDYIITNSSGTIVATGQGTTINETNLNADTYNLNATDATGNCAVNEVIVLSEPNALSITTDVFQDMSCFQADDGAVSVSVTGGLGNYTYNWTKDGNPFATTDDLSALDAGQYLLVVEDTGNISCSISETYLINEPLGLQVSIDSTTDILCNGASTGAINITVGGGTPFTSVAADYQFNWVHDSGTTYITEDLANIPAGTYDLTITDANGCQETLQAILTEPTAVVFNTTKTDISCYDYNDGSITINPTGGVLPYQLTWSDLGNGTTRTNLSPGTYTATIIDGNNCTYTENITIVDAPIFDIIGTKTDISCFGANDGAIDLAVIGGVAPLVLSWNDDPTAGLQRNNLGPGVYDVTITGADGCIQTETYVIDEPLGIQASGVTTDAFDCTDPNSGAIDLTVAGGTLPLRFSWNNGATTEDLTAIPAGNYAVTITDANGCQITENFTIIRQTPLAANVISTIEANCTTKDVAQVNELFITGGFPPHTISWSYGNVDISDPTIMRTSVNGNAVATITDSIGCTTSVIVPVDLLYLGDADFSMNSSFYTDYNIWAINDAISFTNTSTADHLSYSWDFGDGNTSTDENPIHAYVNEGTYQITLTVGYAYGCFYSVSYTIIVGRGYEIEMPNAFTPNNDGINDTFRPVYLGMKEVKMEVYDTWGGLLYVESSTTNTFIGWDGTVDGKAVENGNYIYQLTATARNDLAIQQSGPFTLIK